MLAGLIGMVAGARRACARFATSSAPPGRSPPATCRHRVPGEKRNTEVGRLAAALNVMLGRIQEAFAARHATEMALRHSEGRLRRFVADASHELRTPVQPSPPTPSCSSEAPSNRPEDLARVMSGIRGETARMGHLVEDLLLLARLDESRPIDRAPVDLTLVAGEAVEAARAVGPEWPLETQADGPVMVPGDRVGLRQVLRQPAGQRAGPHSSRHPGDRDDLHREVARPMPDQRQRTRNQRGRTPPGCSSGSSGPIRPVHGPAAAPGWGCPSWLPSWPPTGAGEAAPAPPRRGHLHHLDAGAREPGRRGAGRTEPAQGDQGRPAGGEPTPWGRSARLRGAAAPVSEGAAGGGPIDTSGHGLCRSSDEKRTRGVTPQPVCRPAGPAEGDATGTPPACRRPPTLTPALRWGGPRAPLCARPSRPTGAPDPTRMLPACPLTAGRNRAARRRPRCRLVEVVVPVYNEQRILDASMRRLRRYLDTRLPPDHRHRHRGQRQHRRHLAGRGGAGGRTGRCQCRSHWTARAGAWPSGPPGSQSGPAVVAYMDVDLSTDLDALLPLVAPLLSGHSDVAIGSRLAPGARVKRSLKREVISAWLQRHLAVGSGRPGVGCPVRFQGHAGRRGPCGAADG